MGHSKFQILDDARDQHVYKKLLQDSIIDTLHSLGV